jgi:hypothetical protein
VKRGVLGSDGNCYRRPACVTMRVCGHHIGCGRVWACVFSPFLSSPDVSKGVFWRGPKRGVFTRVFYPFSCTFRVPGPICLLGTVPPFGYLGVFTCLKEGVLGVSQIRVFTVFTVSGTSPSDMRAWYPYWVAVLLF